MNNKRIRIILIVFLVINLIILFIMIGVNIKGKKKTELLNNEIEYRENESKSKGKVGFKDIKILYQNYKGEIAKTDISNRIEVVVNQYFKILFKNVIEKNKDIIEYFNQNKRSIRNRFGITDVEDFKKLIRQIQKLNCSVSEYNSYEVLEDSFIQQGDYTKCILIYTYSNKQEIKFDLYIRNTISEEELEYIFIPKE